MEDRTRIGFYYVWDNSWMGGVMYARNLLKALNTLDDKDKPFIDVYCRNINSYEDLKLHTGYPYMEMVIVNDKSITKRVFRKIVEYLVGYNFSYKIDMFKISSHDMLLYPYGFGSDVNKLVFWCADLQEKFLPELFTKREIIKRDKIIRFVANREIPIVFSSYDSENAFKKFYSEYTNKTFVVHFAVDHTELTDGNIDVIKKKYGIEGNYLLCANQFWKHKNHLFLFKAYQKALQKGLNIQLVCTGRMSDYRNPKYIEEINSFLTENKLENRIIRPGLIDSNELLCLMKHSYAVIQPSLFEGWNTTVEDCKALSKFVFLSDIPVHKEQMHKNVCFFDPCSEDDLVEKLLTVQPVEETYDYSRNLREFGENFLEVIKYVKLQVQ